MIQRPKGTRDFLPKETGERSFVKKCLEELCRKWGYREVATPTFEYLELFTEKSGEEVVKEIYDFEDKGGRKLSLRPEATAPIIRAYLQEMRANPKPIRLYYFSNCFRYEQPQAGRYREFWQFGTEILGGNTPKADAESIALSKAMTDKLGLKTSLEIGHLGILRSIAREKGVKKKDRDKLLSLIDKEEKGKIFQIIGEDINPLLELKGKPEDVLNKLEYLVSSFDVSKEIEDFKKVVNELRYFGLSPTINMSISRGLEYYTGTVFEAYAPGLGAQNQVLGGGSYELSSVFGGEKMRSTGFAFGFDRLIEAFKGQNIEIDRPKKPVFVALVNKSVRDYAFDVVNRLRREDIDVEMDITDRGIGGQISYADSAGYRKVLIIGEKEKEEKNVSVKDMETGEQKSLEIGNVVDNLA